MWLFGRGESGTQVPTCVGDITPIQRSSRETGVLRWGGGGTFYNQRQIAGQVCRPNMYWDRCSIEIDRAHGNKSTVLNSTTIIIMAIV